MAVRREQTEKETVTARMRIVSATLGARLAAVFLFLTLVIAIIGGGFFWLLADNLRRQKNDELISVAEFKARQIEDWLIDHRAFVRSRVEGTVLAEALAGWRGGLDDRQEGRARVQLQADLRASDYVAVEYFDMEGRRLLSAGETLSEPDDIRGLIGEAARQDTPVLLDLHSHRSSDAFAHLGFLTLVHDPDDAHGSPLGAILYSVDAQRTLSPLIQAWPRNTASGEILLVRRVGDDVEFLSELRRRSGAALTFRLPLSRTDLPAALAVTVGRGVYEGLDYQGIAVLSAGDRVAGSPWAVVAKIDRQEVYADIDRLGRYTALLTLTAILGCGVLIFLIWRHQRLCEALERAEQTRIIDRLEQRFRITLNSIGDAIIATDAEGRVELLNPQAEVLTGWSQEEAQGRRLDEVFAIFNEETRQAVESPVQRVLRENRVVGLANHTILISRDGREIPIADSGAPIRDDTGTIIGVVLDFRDQSSERALLNDLHDVVTRCRALFDNLPIMIWEKDCNSVYVSGNTLCAQALKIDISALPGKTDFDFYPRDLAEKYRADDRRVVEQGKIEKLDERWFAEGVDYIVHTTKVPLRNDQGEIYGTLGIAEDITERKAAEAKLAESEATYRSLFGNMLNGFAYCRMEFRDGRPVDFVYLSVNAAFSLHTGLTDVVGKRVSDVIPGIQETDPGLFDIYGRVAKGGAPETFETFVTALDQWFSISVYCPEPEHFVAIFDVITERKQAEEQLRLAAQVFERAGEGIIVTDARQRILTVNQAFTTITGYSADEVLGKTPRVLKSDRHEPSYYQEMWSAIDEQGWWQGEIWNRRKSGNFYLGWLTINLVRDDTGVLTNFIGMFSDITAVKETQRRVDFLATHDELTGLPNRTLFLDRLRQTIARTNRKAAQFALLFIDLDNFKVVNDSLGHAAGDALLIEAARRLRHCVRVMDSVARFGGDEFALLIEDATSAEAEMAACRIAQELTEPVTIGGQDIHVSASVGICFYPSDGTDSGTLLKNADSAMYHAKESGKSTYRFFTQNLKSAADERLHLEAALRHAIDNGDLELHYQPQINLATGRIVGIEALARWSHPTEGMISPSRFIPLAEKSGLIIGLGEWVANAACQQMAQWVSLGIDPPRMSVNVSVEQFKRGQPQAMLKRMLHLHRLPADRVVVELTESALMGDVEQFRRILHDLKDLGLGISIDDFGTGFSSLSYLRRFPIDELKIDRSFVNDIASSSDDRAIAQTIIAMAQTLGLSVVAEGIETREQFDTLRDLGCHIGQGYLFARPLPPVELIDRCRSADLMGSFV